MTTGLNISQQLRSKLAVYDINLTDISQFSTGIDLAHLVNQIFYNGQNQNLISKIIKHQQHRKGNNIINLNIVLKTLKNDPNLKSIFSDSPHIANLSAFTLIQEHAKLKDFVQWILQAANGNKKISFKQNQQKGNLLFQKIHLKGQQQKLQYKTENHQSYQACQSGLDNLYFAKDLPSQSKQPLPQLNDSLEGSGDKVVKKGSFKMIRPKSQFKISSPQRQLSQQSPKILNQKKGVANSVDYRQKQISQRKTVPKMMERPPMYRQNNKQNTKIRQKNYQNGVKPLKPPQPTAFSCQSNKSHNSNQSQPSNKSQDSQIDYQHKANSGSSFKQPSIMRQQIRKDLQKLDRQISSEEQSVKKIEKSRSVSANMNSSSKKIFKHEIRQVTDIQKRQMVQWLISINMLNSMAVNYYTKLHQICKNGVIFPEIINHQKGRGSELCYFKDPKRSAQMNSNYQKVFNFMKQQPNFTFQLMFMYEYFIPEVQQKAFWRLLKSLYNCFARLRKMNEDKPIVDYQNSIKKKFPRTTGSSSTPINKMNNEICSLKKEYQVEYQKIKYGSTNHFKEQVRHQSQKKERSQNLENGNVYKRKSSQRKIQFIKQLPAQAYSMKQQLIQKQQPQQCQAQHLRHGYSELYQKKTTKIKHYDTPKKCSSAINTSMSRSRILSTMGSIKKSDKKLIAIPQVNLQMEMKVLSFLKEKSYQSFFNREDKELFKDPLRNGVMLNNIIKQQLQMSYAFYQKPKSIQNCRENYKLALSNIKRRVPDLDPGYQTNMQSIIKGDKSLFYGLVYQIIKMSTFEFATAKSHPLSRISNQNYSFAIPGRNYTNNHIKIFSTQTGNEQQKQILWWIRDLEQYSDKISEMKIRDIKSLTKCLVSGNFLFAFVLILSQKNIVSPNYIAPSNEMQQQSNLKKIISFMVQNRYLASQYTSKIKKIIRKDQQTVSQLLKDLISISKNNLITNQGQQRVTFVKYMRDNSKQAYKKSNQNERLDTTMANQSIGFIRSNQNGTIINYSALQCKKSGLQNYQHHFQSQALSTPQLQIKWMRKLGFSGDLSLNNGVTLCRVIERLTMKTIQGLKQKPQSKAQSLMNVRRALKVLGKDIKWDQNDILEADCETNMEIYKFLKDKYKHAYALKLVNC